MNITCFSAHTITITIAAIITVKLTIAIITVTLTAKDYYLTRTIIIETEEIITYQESNFNHYLFLDNNNSITII